MKDDFTQKLQAGELVVFVDDLKTGVGMIVGLAEFVTPEKVNVMTKIGKGLVSICLSDKKAKHFSLLPMVEGSISHAVSVDYKTNSTGISAFDRADTIKAFTSEDTVPEDFIQPGHMFPKVSDEGGLLKKIDIVEGIYDLARLSSSLPIGYMCEILNDEGHLASKIEINHLAQEHQLMIVKMSEILELRKNDVLNQFSGKVIHGNQIGRKIGYPTANLLVDMKDEQLDRGVYGVNVSFNGNQYVGVMNVGVRPTIKQGKESLHYEVHLLDFNETIYGETLEVDVCFYLRNEISFSNMDQLLKQIKKDVAMVRGRLCKKGVGVTHWTGDFIKVV